VAKNTLALERRELDLATRNVVARALIVGVMKFAKSLGIAAMIMSSTAAHDDTPCNFEAPRESMLALTPKTKVHNNLRPLISR